MNEEVWAVIKYKPKEGCEQEFIDALSRLDMSHVVLNRYIKAYNGEILQIVQSRNMVMQSLKLKTKTLNKKKYQAE